MLGSRNLFARRRVVLVGDMIGVPNLMLFGRYNNTSAQHFINPHQYEPDQMVICLLVRGRQLYRVGQQDYPLRGGDALVVFPNEIHSTGGAPQEKGVLYWMHLRLPRSGATFLGLSEDLAAPLVQALLRIRPRHFRGTSEMKRLCDDIYLTYHRPQSPIRATRIANQTVAFLLQLVESAHQASTKSISPGMRDVVHHIEQHIAEPLAIRELATRAGLSVSRFKARFKETTGIPPGQYIQRAKIEEAKRRLACGNTTVTAVAFALGFSTSQYFATVFKRYTGHTPNVERKTSTQRR